MSPGTLLGYASGGISTVLATQFDIGSDDVKVWIPILVSVVGAMGGIWRRSVKQAVELQVLRAENGELRDGLASVREEMKATAKIRAETLRRLRGENAVLHDEVNSLKSELISNAASRERLHNEINELRRSFTKGGATQ